MYPFVVEAVGAHNVFFFFGGVSLVCGVLSTIILPETKGKSLEQIQEYFEKKTSKASEGKTEKEDASQMDNKKTCSSNDESLMSSVAVVTSPTAEKTCMKIQLEDVTKL